MADLGTPLGIGRIWSRCIQILSLVVSTVTPVTVVFDWALLTTEPGHPAGSFDSGLVAVSLGGNTTKFIYSGGGI